MDNLTKDWLSGVLKKYENKPGDEHRWGVVDSVAEDGSLVVKIGDGEPAVCSAACTAEAGDVVLVCVTRNGQCVAIGRRGGDIAVAPSASGGATEQATFHRADGAIVAETASGWVDIALDDCSSKTDGFDSVASFSDGVITFFKGGCYEISANAYWNSVTGQVGVGIFDDGAEEWSVFCNGPSSASVAIPPVTIKVNAGETRKIRHYVHPGAQTRHGKFTWVTISYFGVGGSSGDNPGGGGGTGESGATFYPRVDKDGNLSWTNDKGLPNPETVNIMGKDGRTPVKGEDYFTSDDVRDIAAAAVSMLPVYAGEVA